MSKLLAAIFAAMFALGTVSAFAAAKDEKKVEKLTAEQCKDVKNKDHKDCKVEKKAEKK